ncbi:MAG: sigma-70 family RNA polymerase sigma factor [Actinomycetota bacterium]|nr:sigma-70 family RNA polymerase sigma factor [Actinomycetota bacterium]
MPAERFTAAYRELSPRVLGYLRSHGVDDPEAVTNDVFLALHQNFDRITGDDDGVRTLTFSIAHARIVDYHRSRSIRPQPVPYDPGSDLRRSPSAEDIAMENLGHGVLAILHNLGEDQREAVSLRVIAGLSLEETAAVMQKSIGAIKQLQRRALESLRSSLSGGAGHD